MPSDEQLDDASNVMVRSVSSWRGSLSSSSPPWRAVPCTAFWAQARAVFIASGDAMGIGCMSLGMRHDTPPRRPGFAAAAATVEAGVAVLLVAVWMVCH